MQSLKSILLIDNDPDDQEFFIDSLHSVSSTAGCYAVDDGDEALRVLRQENFVPDYIFLDLNCSGMNAIKFLKELRATEESRLIPVIVFSDASDDKKREAMQLGVTAFYSKSRPIMLPKILKKYVGESLTPVSIL